MAAAHPKLNIPPDIHPQLLLNSNFSIAELLRFHVPDILDTGEYQEPIYYLERHLPTCASIEAITSFPCPPPEVAQALIDAIQLETEDLCSQSISIPYTTMEKDETYPLWVASYWKAAGLMRRTQQRWEEALARAKQLAGIDADRLSQVAVAEEALENLPWSGNIQGFSKNATDSTENLSRYLTTEWLTGEHVQQMLDLLQHELDENGFDDIAIGSTWFYATICKAAKAKDDYMVNRYYRWLRAAGHNHETGWKSIIAFAAHIGSNHWVPVSVDYRRSVIHYGDSLGGENKELEKNLLWWTHFHSGRHFSIAKLPTTQQRDMFSCGLLACNALRCYLLKLGPSCLVPASNVAAARLEVFNAVTEVHLAAISAESEGDLDSNGDSEEDGDVTDSGESDVEMSVDSNERLPMDSDNDSDIDMDVTRMVDKPSNPRAITTTIKPKVMSSIRVAAQLSNGKSEKRGLLAFYKVATVEQREEQNRKGFEEVRRNTENLEYAKAKHDARLVQEKRDGARLRKQKSRGRKKTIEILAGIRSPGGRKKKIIDVHLEDSSPLLAATTDTTVAELTRPHRKLKRAALDKKKKKSGRKRKHAIRPAKYHDWHIPFVWHHIVRAVKHVGWKMSASAIVSTLQKWEPEIFAGLTRSTVDGWIDRTGPKPKWKEEVAEMAERPYEPGHSKGGQRGVLSKHPDVVDVIKSRLEFLFKQSAPLNVVTVRGVMIATIMQKRPEILETEYRDGSHFRASDDFVRRWLKSEFDWRRRKATRAANKIPENWEDLCERSFLRIAYSIKEYGIPSALFVNADQTQVIYAPGDKLTYAPIGAKQVSLVGGDEKRAFTLLVAIANDGTLLPFQGIYEGKTERSLPDRRAPHYKDFMELGSRLDFSGTGTYWSNQKTMRTWIDKILAPYYERRKQELGLPQSQRSLLQWDVWSVHRSQEMRDWLTENHPTILVRFVPAKCTGVHQACDVGIQRSLKHSVKRSYHEGVVNDMLEQLEEGQELVVADKRLAQMRDRSVGWLWDAFNALNDKKFIKKAFEMCRVREWNLSYESLTSFAAQEKLRNLRKDDPQFWKELNNEEEDKDLPTATEVVDEDREAGEDDDGVVDDSSVPLAAVMRHAQGRKHQQGVELSEEGGLTFKGTAEQNEQPDSADESDVADPPPATAVASSSTSISRSGRVRIPNKWFSQDFWRHHGEDGHDSEEEEE